MCSYNLKKYCILSEDFCTFTNSIDIEEMLHYAAFHLGIHCLQKYLLEVFRISFLVYLNLLISSIQFDPQSLGMSITVVVTGYDLKIVNGK